MGFPISTNLFRSISDSGKNLTRGAEILDKEIFFLDNATYNNASGD